MTEIEQYIAVFIILGLTAAWILHRLFSKKGRESGARGCAGCALSDSCAKRNRESEAEECEERGKNIKKR